MAGSNLNFTLENSGSSVIDQLQVKFFGSGGFGANDTVLIGDNVSNFQPGNTWMFIIAKPAAASGTLEQVKIVPRVKVVGRSEYAYCTDAALTFTDVPDC